MRVFTSVKACLLISVALAGNYINGFEAALAEGPHLPNAMPAAASTSPPIEYSSMWPDGTATGSPPAIIAESVPTPQPTFSPFPQLTAYPVLAPIEFATVAPLVEGGGASCAQHSLLTIISALPEAMGTISSMSIQNLIDRLGSDDFTEREFAQEILYRLGHQAYIELSQASWQSPDAEIRRRASRILEGIGNTGYSGAFLATLSRALATIDTDAVPTSSKLELALQIESRIPGMTVRLRDVGQPVVERVVSEVGDLILTQPYTATFSNAATDNSIDIIITNFTPEMPQEVNHGETVHLQITLPVTISLGCLPIGVNAILVFDIETAQIEIRYVGAVIEEGQG